LPPYSPDLNPIEQAFAKIKHWMRSAQKRTIEDAWRHIGSLVETIDPTDSTMQTSTAVATFDASLREQHPPKVSDHLTEWPEAGANLL
jgi:transposase